MLFSHKNCEELILSICLRYLCINHTSLPRNLLCHMRHQLTLCLCPSCNLVFVMMNIFWETLFTLSITSQYYYGRGSSGNARAYPSCITYNMEGDLSGSFCPHSISRLRITAAEGLIGNWNIHNKFLLNGCCEVAIVHAICSACQYTTWFLLAEFCDSTFWTHVYQRHIKFTWIYTEIVLKLRNVQDFQNLNRTMSWNLG